MSDTPPPTPTERAEAARVRRRWLTLGEVLAIAAVAISGLTLWNSYRERTESAAEHRADRGAAAHSAATLILRATPDRDGRTLALAPRLDSQVIGGQTIRFPAALALAPVETTGDARIERGWFADALVKARKAAGAGGSTTGDARLPILIETRFLADGTPVTDRAVYEVGYAADRAFFGGTTIRLRGLSRVGRAASVAAGQAQIDALAKGRLG